MRGLLSQFDTSLALAAVITAASLGVAALTAHRDRRLGRPWLGHTTRVLAIGSVLVAAVSTSLPRSLGVESGGDLVLAPGRAGLGDLAQVFDDPNSLAGVVLLANVVLYIPVAFFGILGWNSRPLHVLAACLVLSVLVETVQLLFLGRVAATDDVILNFTGASIGFVAGLALLRYWPWVRGQTAVDRSYAGPSRSWTGR